MENLDVTEDWSKHRVLVTGATGIVGSWLVKRLLESRAYVVTLIRDWDPQAELIRSGDVHRTAVINGALEEYSALERAISEHEIDTVFHLGAQTIVGTALRSPLPTFEANVRGTYNLLEACRFHSSLVERVVVASSDKAYGEAETLPYTEETPLNGRHPYDLSKSCADLIAISYAHTYKLPVTVARCGNIFGGGDLNWSRIVPGTIRSVLHNQRPILRSDGKYVRDYVYVLDIAAAYMLLAERTADEHFRGHAFNFSPERPMTVLDMTNTILTLMGRKDLEPVILNEAKAEIKNQYLNSDKAKRWLNWAPRYTLAQGLGETIEWYQGCFAMRGLPVAHEEGLRHVVGKVRT